ncbi:myo-inositol oxygenase [Columba livia]|uniref:Myo-inositol oxygenase n=1 Tax=Columba livia TaxID=8932 RepID=A0A2I0LIK8_COLLI|nr:myo-inositol oxygenase [Columba livia]
MGPSPARPRPSTGTTRTGSCWTVSTTPTCRCTPTTGSTWWGCCMTWGRCWCCLGSPSGPWWGTPSPWAARCRSRWFSAIPPSTTTPTPGTPGTAPSLGCTSPTAAWRTSSCPGDTMSPCPQPVPVSPACPRVRRRSTWCASTPSTPGTRTGITGTSAPSRTCRCCPGCRSSTSSTSTPR